MAALTTVLHAIQNHNVDVVLALLLIVSGVIGAQYGTVAGARLKGEQMRFLLAALVLFGGLVEFRSALLTRRMTDLDVYLRAAWAVRSGAFTALLTIVC